MFNERELWKERLGHRVKELSRYLRYIFNGHIVIVLIFLLGTAAYSYQEWLKTVPEQFPAAIIMAVIIGLLLTYSSISTLLLEADRIFLLPLESRLSKYFSRSIILCFVIHSYLLFMGIGIFMPLYARVNNGDFRAFLPFLLAALFMKALNLFIRWKVQHYVDKRIHLFDSFVRYTVNTVFLFFLFSGSEAVFLFPEIVLMLILLVFYSKNTKAMGLKWEYLIEQEERRMTAFYRLANMFTDVPNLRDQVKRRKWLDWLLYSPPFKQENTFAYLFIRTFLRAGDYLGLFVRLTLIGGVIIYITALGFGQVLIVLLFMYLTGFQLLPLWNHHQNKLWVNLYPLEDRHKEKLFKQLLLRILLIQAILFSAVVLVKGQMSAAVIIIIAGIVFAFFFTYIYINRKIQTQT